MKIEYKRLGLSPYPGEVLVFKNLEHMKAKYTQLTKTAYEYKDEITGGRFVHIRGEKHHNDVYLVYAKQPHVLAHELCHILLILWEQIGSEPAAGRPSRCRRSQ